MFCLNTTPVKSSIYKQFRHFAIINKLYNDGSELQDKYFGAKLQRKLKMIEAIQNDRKFHKQEPEKRLIKNFDDLENERARLQKELKLTSQDVESATNDELTQRYQQLYREQTEHGYEIDKTQFYQSSVDNMRVDCGLIIIRPPIFLSQSKTDYEFLRFRHKIMSEYHIDLRKYHDGWAKESKTVSSLESKNPLLSLNNKDNMPTKEVKNQDGKKVKHYGASKYWRLVNPNVTDHHSLHYASSQRIYLLFKNKYTDEWEFPTKPVYGGDSFGYVRMKLFSDLTDDKWLVRHLQNSPAVSTLRPFTKAEQQERLNSILSGVRTYYFHAFHLRGLPQFNFQNTDYQDYAWVPKNEMNQFLTKDKFEIFQNSFTPR